MNNCQANTVETRRDLQPIYFFRDIWFLLSKIERPDSYQ